MWQSYAQALFLALALSGMAFGIAKLVVVVGERLIEKRYGTVGARDMLVRRARLETALEARRLERSKEIKALDEETREVVRRRQQLDRQITDLVRGGERLVHLIGEEVKGRPCFHAEVLNKYVGATATPQQQQHAFVDAMWAQAQAMEVWAANVAEARHEIECRYPPSLGYKIIRLQQAGGQPVPAAEDKPERIMQPGKAA